MREAADAERLNLAGMELPLSFITTPKKKMIDFPGYAYKHVDSSISGSKALVYDSSTPQTWQIPFYWEVVEDKTVRAPEGGYFIPPSLTHQLQPLLDDHDIEYMTIDESEPNLKVEVFRAMEIDKSRTSLEGRQTVKLGGKWSPETQTVLDMLAANPPPPGPSDWDP